MYRYRIYPSSKQRSHLLSQFSICKDVFNQLLGEQKKIFITNKYDFNALVRDIKLTAPQHYAQVYSQVLQNVGDRVVKALENFFRRVQEKKAGKKIKAGFPRFKTRVQSITYPQSGFKFTGQRRLQVSKVGAIPIVLHRMMKGKIKTMTIKRNSTNQWFAVFACDIPEEKKPVAPALPVGIDVGLTHFATLSNGERIENPRHLNHALAKLRKAQRRLSRKQKGSRNREKARLRVARIHNDISNCRIDFLHKTSNSLTAKYSSLFFENLSIKEMMKTRKYSRSIADAGWYTFRQFLTYKAVTRGGQAVPVIAKNTTQGCSRCGAIVPKGIEVRVHSCSCGLVMDRDHNAAINILNGVRLDEPELTPVETRPLPFLRETVSCVAEAGTTRQRASTPMLDGSLPL